MQRGAPTIFFPKMLKCKTWVSHACVPQLHLKSPDKKLYNKDRNPSPKAIAKRTPYNKTDHTIDFTTLHQSQPVSHPANVLHAKPRCLTSCQLLCQSQNSISMNIKLLALKPPATIFKAPPCTAISDFTEKRCPSKTCTRTVQPAKLAMAISMSAPLDQFLLSQ